MELLETVPLLIIDDLGMRKLPPNDAEETAGDHHATRWTGRHAAGHELPLVRFDTDLRAHWFIMPRSEVELYLLLAEHGSIPVPATKEDQE